MSRILERLTKDTERCRIVFLKALELLLERPEHSLNIDEVEALATIGFTAEMSRSLLTTHDIDPATGKVRDASLIDPGIFALPPRDVTDAHLIFYKTLTGYLAAYRKRERYTDRTFRVLQSG
jgi:recombinational DNA repair protein (RecF pathway)